MRVYECVTCGRRFRKWEYLDLHLRGSEGKGCAFWRVKNVEEGSGQDLLERP